MWIRIHRRDETEDLVALDVLEYSESLGQTYTLTSQNTWTKSRTITIPEPRIPERKKMSGIVSENNRLLSLYSLNRFPGKPTVCNKCGQLTTQFVTRGAVC